MVSEQTENAPRCFQRNLRRQQPFLKTRYPQYRRRCPEEGGNVHKTKDKGNEFTVDNSFIVPYNHYLSLRYDTQINVEIVNSVKAVKYLYTYITKGQDRIVFGLREDEHDDMSHYQSARYISASEVFCRIYGFEIHRKFPPVEKLPCHLPNEQTVLFQDNDIGNIVEEHLRPS